MSRIYDIADRYIDDLAKLDPIVATYIGISKYEDQLTDYSPAGYEERHQHSVRTLERLNEAELEGERDRLARDFMVERLTREVAIYESGEHFRDVGVMWTAVQSVRDVFDFMPRESNDQWRNIAARMSKVSDAIEGYVTLLREGVKRDLVGTKRLAAAVAKQAQTWAGVGPDGSRFFAGMVEEYESRSNPDRKVADSLRKACVGADEAYQKLGTFLLDEYVPVASDVDGVGEERYRVAAGYWLGEEIDVLATYAWGWDEFHRVDAEVRAVCAEIKPGASLKDVIAELDDDHERWIHGEAALVDWLQGLLDRAITRLNGEHFDIPEPLQRIDVKIPPAGGAEAPTYSAPSEDLRRPGTFWHPTGGRTRFPMWSEISTAYHEGVPGHHLQFGYVKMMHDELSRFQRNDGVSGHMEGWALYAERLMDELGFLERPEYRLDMLINSLFRAARVVIDIGMHLGLRIPEGEAFHPGEVWTPELALEMLGAVTNFSASHNASEIDRYLGMPGQAIGYKVGERVWMEVRAARKAAEGDAFDLKAFHHEALSLGPLGLAQLRQELAPK